MSGCLHRFGASLPRPGPRRAGRSRKTALQAERRLIYVDSSALVKLVIDEPESAALARYLVGNPVLATSSIATVEVSRATALANPSHEVREEAERLLTSCTLVAVTTQLLDVARKLTSSAVRTLDAIHLASALRIEPDELLAYDQRLLEAARQRGLSTSTPK